MMNKTRRTVLLSSLSGFAALLLGPGISSASASKKERIIKIEAKKFVFTPHEIVIRKGEHVVLEVTSVDFVHGISIPDFNIRADLPPGSVTKIRLNPDKVGKYDFICDNFCGSGHEEMEGTIFVKN
jgi:cytochrome c oxidase subunit 2